MLHTRSWNCYIHQSVKIFKQKHEKEIEELKAKHRAELALREEFFDRQADEIIAKVGLVKNDNEKLQKGIHA